MEIFQPPSSLWLSDRPLVLASGSPARKVLLEAAGIPLTIAIAAIDERGIEASIPSAAPEEIACHLARAKAKSVCAAHPDHLVAGADQTLALDGHLFHKPTTRQQAIGHLEALSGRVHDLHTALSVWRDNVEVFHCSARARLKVRHLSSGFIAEYLATIGKAAFASVGTYQVEGVGIQLFDWIEGEHSTILGLPLLALLGFLRDEGSLSS